MKIHLLSDIHLEWAPMPADYTPPKEADVIVLAGDIGVGTKGLEWAAKLATDTGKPVIKVAGNHTYYDKYPMRQRQAKLRIAAELYQQNGMDVHFLERDTVTIDDVTFVGATLWTDFRLGKLDQAYNMFVAQQDLNDYTRMTWNDDSGDVYRARPFHTLKEHAAAVKYIRGFNKKVSSSTSKPSAGSRATVVVTHHAPHPNSINVQRYTSRELDPAYASDLTELIEEHDFDLWVHGHTHSSFDYVVGTTRIVSNPRGYARPSTPELCENIDFDPGLLVEV